MKTHYCQTVGIKCFIIITITAYLFHCQLKFQIFLAIAPKTRKEEKKKLSQKTIFRYTLYHNKKSIGSHLQAHKVILSGRKQTENKTSTGIIFVNISVE